MLGNLREWIYAGLEPFTKTSGPTIGPTVSGWQNTHAVNEVGHRRLTPPAGVSWLSLEFTDCAIPSVGPKKKERG